MKKDEEPLIETVYAEDEVAEYANTRVPRWLKWLYVLTPIWAVIWLVLFWGGSRGWLDRGYWYELEEAAKTTFPLEQSAVPDPASDTPYIQPLPGV